MNLKGFALIILSYISSWNENDSIVYIYIYISCSILKKESKLTFENVPTMSWIQSTEISGELLFSQLLDSFLEIYRDLLQKNVRSDVSM